MLTRYSDFYQTHTLKQYMVGDRMVRQWTLIAAREQDITPTLEGGLDFRKNLTEAIDGYAGSEHAYAIMPLYNDVVQTRRVERHYVHADADCRIRRPMGENYWFEHYDIHDDPEAAAFHAARRGRSPRPAAPGMVRRQPVQLSIRWPLRPRRSSRPAAASASADTASCRDSAPTSSCGRSRVAACRSHDVLRVGTIFGAEAIGVDKDLGSLEPGKLADLQVLDKNPLDDIRNTNTITYVMQERTALRRQHAQGDLSAGARDSGTILVAPSRTVTGTGPAIRPGVRAPASRAVAGTPGRP